MRLDEAQQRAAQVRALYGKLEQRRYGRAWSTQEIMLGFAGDVGDLAKLVQGAAGVRPTEQLQAKLTHELADCLWSVLVLAERLEVDLEEAFTETMAGLEAVLRRELGE